MPYALVIFAYAIGDQRFIHELVAAGYVPLFLDVQAADADGLTLWVAFDSFEADHYSIHLCLLEVSTSVASFLLT